MTMRRRVAVLVAHVVGAVATKSEENDDDDDDDDDDNEIQSADEWISSVGRQFFPKRRYKVTQNAVDAFAKVTRDAQWIHAADAATRNSSSKPPFSFGEEEQHLPIAHGFFVLSLLTHLHGAPKKSKTWCRCELNVGMNRVRFRKPVEVGSVLRCQTRVQSVEWKRGREMLETTYECEMMKEGEEDVVVELEWIVRQVLV